MQRAFLALMIGLALASPAPAQDSEVEPGPPEESILPPGSPNLQSVLVIGDTLGGGLGAGLLRMAEPLGRYEITLRYNDESGLARPEIYDWNARLAAMLQAADYDIAVVMMGGNDRQQMKIGNIRLAFNSAEWVEAYGNQVDNLLAQLSASGVKVYWVGLPPMADTEYDEALQAISALQRQRVEAAGATFIDMRAHLADGDGRYTDMGRDEFGDVKRLRARDGVSFSKEGNNRMAQIVVAGIANLAPIGPEPPPVAEATEEETVPDAADQPEIVPVFGQIAGQFGEELLVEPEGVVATVALVTRPSAAKPMTPQEVMAALKAAAKPGSRASSLFTTGTASAAPAGRLDDYAVPAAP